MLARYTNANIAEYLIPVCADIGEIEIIMVPETDDAVNPLGMKGIGELGVVGMNAAIANAVHHATGTPGTRAADPARPADRYGRAWLRRRCRGNRGPVVSRPEVGCKRWGRGNSRGSTPPSSGGPAR